EADNRWLRARSKELEAERDEYQELYEIGPLAAVTLDASYSIHRLNHAAALLLHDVPERIYHRNFRSFLSAESRPRFSQHLARVAGRGAIESVRLRVEPAPDESFPVEIWTRVSPFRGIYEMRIVDLTEQERLEEEALRLSESEREAREESAAKDKFIAVLSHELRTPLTPVLAATSALQRKRLAPELSDVFRMIERNVSAEARLIDDLLDVNRIVRNKMLLEPVVADVHAVALEAVENLRSDAEAKEQALEVALSATQTVANVDVARLRQVFSNLLKNAIKFTPRSGHIRLCSWNGEETVAVEVQDDGIGIEPNAMRRLFEPFREDRGPSSGGGLGLGLTICKGLVDLQGGRIAAHSRGLGQGSRFVVEFPFLTGVVPVKTPSGPDATKEAPTAAESSIQRVLLVEDHPDTVEVLTALLVDKGFRVQSAGSLEAARLIDLEKVDVIVSDIGLPDGTGLELMKELRGSGRARRPAIALTGFGMESDVRASQEAGFDLHLTKPVSIERLVDAIHSLAPSAASAT
ncbi:MAG TPA: ATP-binding protein, partial [Polyangiaceae bacterium]